MSIERAGRELVVTGGDVREATDLVLVAPGARPAANLAAAAQIARLL